MTLTRTSLRSHQVIESDHATTGLGTGLMFDIQGGFTWPRNSAAGMCRRRQTCKGHQVKPPRASATPAAAALAAAGWADWPARLLRNGSQQAGRPASSTCRVAALSTPSVVDTRGACS